MLKNTMLKLETTPIASMIMTMITSMFIGILQNLDRGLWTGTWTGPWTEVVTTITSHFWVSMASWRLLNIDSVLPVAISLLKEASSVASTNLTIEEYTWRRTKHRLQLFLKSSRNIDHTH